MIEFIVGLAEDVALVWLVSVCIGQWLCEHGKSDRAGIFVWIHQQLWILVPLGLLGMLWAAHGLSLLASVFTYAVVTFDAWMWWKYRNWPDDNKWTKRRKRLAAKVAALRGKLVVVPATT